MGQIMVQQCTSEHNVNSSKRAKKLWTLTDKIKRPETSKHGPTIQNLVPAVNTPPNVTSLITVGLMPLKKTPSPPRAAMADPTLKKPGSLTHLPPSFRIVKHLYRTCD